jgi:hypothetical protein
LLNIVRQMPFQGAARLERASKSYRMERFGRMSEDDANPSADLGVTGFKR